MKYLALLVCSFLISALPEATLAQLPSPPPSAANSSQEPVTPEAVEQAGEVLLRFLDSAEGRKALNDYLQNSGATDEPTAQTAPAADGQTASAAPEAKADADAAAVAETEAVSQTFAVRLGQYTRVVADDFGLIIERVRASLRGIALLATGELQIRWDRVSEAFLSLATVLLSATVISWLGRWLVAKVYDRLDVKARYGGWTTRTGILIFTSVLDGLAVLLGWGGGYVVALASFGGLETGVTLLESLALNAFLFSGLALVALRFVFEPGRPALRLLPFDDWAAGYWTRWLGFVFVLLIYGIMLGVPLANQTVSFVFGNAVRFLVVLCAAATIAVLIVRNKKRVEDGIRTYAENLSGDLGKKSMTLLARTWHIIAFFYVLMTFLIWLFRPYDATQIIVRSTGLSVLTIMASVLASLMMTRAIVRGIRLPDSLRESLPALQGRLNAFVPRILKIFRFAVGVLTVLLLLDIWHIASFTTWARSPQGADVIGRYGSAVMVLLFAFGIWIAVMSWVDLRLRSRSGYVVTARVRTLFQLFRNAFTVVIIVMASLLALSEIGINIGPLIAGAGVVGLAISFGAQTLVKDIITGAFIQIENAINEGDVVTVAGTTGVVERLTVRSVRIRDLDGTAHIVPFSSVDMVSNFMRDFSYHVAVIGVSYSTDIAKAKGAMVEAFNRLRNSDLGPKILDDFEMHGVTMFGDSAINIRARIKTLPGEQWGVGRAFNEYVKQVFDEEGIEIPFPQVTYHAAPPPAMAGRPSKKTESVDADPEGASPTQAGSDGPAEDR
ncbi:mechanosensitive ion channel protein MscS [Roseibium aquae]|uniref:Mechanosensitive ion channel protein MscS n=1 Tax=Roseibium aquae TaxID=1323746 RepID=A0A916T5Z6_9HYPH|nr:mechanosensitive ion channel domain-containing protein [Roseibium aquae]GGB33112.1 mechanosensitive ion channel protein MscS [Roseibium aquae]